MRVLPLILLLSIPALAQSEPVTVQIKDASAPGSPVVLSGTATAKDAGSGVLRYSLAVKVSAVNVSGRDVLLMVVERNISGLSSIGVDGPWSQEYFFSTEIFSCGTAENFNHVIGPFGTSEREVDETSAAPGEPRAIFSVVFVQFVDGSMWGNMVKAKPTLQERRSTLNMLKSLRETYAVQGEKEFVSELMKKSSLNVIYQVQKIYQTKGNDAEAALKAIEGMLDQAELHSHAMEIMN
jgi:hypothetical protein